MEKFHGFGQEKLFVETLKTPAAIEKFERLFIGQQIKKLRHRLQIQQKQLATALGTTQSVIARIENGRQNLSLRQMVRIAFALGKKISLRFL